MAILVCLDVPHATEFGIDYESFRTTEKFKGVKHIPIGVHFVFFSSGNIRHGFFLNITKDKEIAIRGWDSKNEWIHSPGKSIHIENLKVAVDNFEFDGHLGNYPQKHFKSWHSLSNYITTTVLKRCGIDVAVTHLLIPGSQNAETDISIINSEGTIDADNAVVFTSTQRSVVGTNPAARTRYCLDCSHQLDDLLNRVYDHSWEDLLGEFQLAFILFLHLSSLGALHQWKQMMWLLCSSESSPEILPDLYVAFLRVLFAQLQQVSADFFNDELSEENFLISSLASLFEILDGIEAQSEIQKLAERLKKLLKTRFSIDMCIFGCFDFVDSSCSPVLVTPNEIPASAWTQNECDTDEFNLRVANQFLANSNKT